MKKSMALASDTWSAPADASGTVFGRFDVGASLHIGDRTSQQDAITTDFAAGDEVGIAVLADGMGGHFGGEVASTLAVSEGFAELKARSIVFRSGATAGDAPATLRQAVDRANTAIGTYLASDPKLGGMGTTMVACMTLGPTLYWASVGDSPLYLYRDNTLRRLNADHSMAPNIDAMAATGMIDATDAANHPQRHQLLSAVCGDTITQVDCPDEPFTLQTGDVVILASDGLQTLDDNAICAQVHQLRKSSGKEIARALIEAVIARKADEQDNISVIAMKLGFDTPMTANDPVAPEEGPVNTNVKPATTTSDIEIEEASDLLNAAFFD